MARPKKDVGTAQALAAELVRQFELIRDLRQDLEELRDEVAFLQADVDDLNNRKEG